MAILAKKEAKKQGKEVVIAVDLASWKMRTGKAARVLKPVVLAQKKQTVTVVLTSKKQAFTCVANSSHAINHMATVAVSDMFISLCEVWNNIIVTDARGKIREMAITQKDEKKIFCTLSGKTIVDSNSLLTVEHNNQLLQEHPQRIRPQPEKIYVQEGDEVYIGGDIKCSRAATKNHPVRLSITDPIALEWVKKWDHIFIDDGKLGLSVTKKHKKGVSTRVIYAKNKKVEIMEEKGINFPDTIVAMPALSTTDKELLPQIAQFADLINISFVQTQSDIYEVQTLLKKAGKPNIPIVAKIETKEWVRNLPQIISALHAHGTSWVMIARGDLAVETWFASLPYTQEKILSICESAYMPVIYATWVMETSMKNRLPARAEVIDVAMSKRANCLMLNKWSFVFDTIPIIHEIYESFSVK